MNQGGGGGCFCYNNVTWNEDGVIEAGASASISAAE